MARMLNESPSHHQGPAQPAPPEVRSRFRIEWLLVPLCILGMLYVLYHIKPVISWEDILDYCNVDRDRYTMLGQLCLIGILVVGAVKIFGRK